MAEDLFRTAALRRRVLDAWAASPARFREDANAEEDLALGGYRDRLIVELAQNAADAAARAGVPGRLRLELRDGALVASNTGAALDAAGVESLSTLRASAKRDEPAVEGSTVGRFGVGFAAVLAVSDTPAVVGEQGGVRWSLAEARALAAEIPELAAELGRREGHVPLLRLPLATETGLPADVPGPVAQGYDTAVVLPLRDASARELTVRLLDAVDDGLLLSLPGLTEVTVETPDRSRTLSRREDGPYTLIGDRRWRVARQSGSTAAELLADRPVEERNRPFWSVTWAVPVDGAGAPVPAPTAPYVHAPTPTDEPLGLPALLIASFPLEPTRRRVAPGPLTDFLLQRAAETYTELLREWSPVADGILDLVPGPLGRDELDGTIRELVLRALPDTAFLASAARTEDGEPYALRPREAELAEGAGSATVAALCDLLPHLLPAGLERRPELRALGVTRVPLGELIDRLAGVERPASWWYRLYDSLAGVDPDRLTGLPVPLADGRTAIGPRQALLPLPDGTGGGGHDGGGHGARVGHGGSDGRSGALSALAPSRLAALGLKIAHADAAHPLLEKLGATPAAPRAVLTTPQVRAAVAASLEAEEAWDDGLDDQGAPDPEELAETVLALVEAATLAPGDEPWLGALALPDEYGELQPAAELVYPGSPFSDVVREGELPLCDAELVARWGRGPLTAVGVLADFALVRAHDVVLEPDELEPQESDFPAPDDAGLLDAVDVWCEDVLDTLPETPVPPVATEVLAVRDLDLVDDDRWPQALAMLSRPPLRDALTQRVRVLLPDGTAESVRPYTAWWLRGHPVLDGRRPAGLRAAGGDPLLDGLYEEVDAQGFDDPQVLHALGVRTTAAALLDEPGGAAELLGRLADPERPVTPNQLHALYSLLARLDPEEVTLPDELRAVRDGRTCVVDASEAVIADAPDLLPLAYGRALLPVRPALAAELAALLEVGRLSRELPTDAPTGGEWREVPETVRELLGDRAPDGYWEHEELDIGGAELDWRLPAGGELHAATLEGVAAGLAWAAGHWPRRFELAALLEDGSRVAELRTARWFA
ncbi:molecular chaperone Hsp90 [Streptomyces sp. P38-E01]|uniref:Molecular chaperone Hsp90 n=1 Tax=Streptomyces tardus TaxID=2780544 RepID=A0A949N3M1_9ACTN|nr:molecular chaperone Hsp90 [Streptomyces tardus]MBU7597004.1 molecular chaperone Hsp90 [Streptomyces tardus]